MDLPELGVGLVYLPGLEPIFETIRSDLDVLEIEPQTFWSNPPRGRERRDGFRVDHAALERCLRLGRPVLAHSVGYPVGGSNTGDARHLPALRETFSALKPAWWSEHMSFVAAPTGGETRPIGFLMPPVQSCTSIASAVDRIRSLQDEFGLPFAFETGVNYLRPAAGEIPDGHFWGEIADRADCGILLDLHNLWANGRNGRPGIAEAAASLPLERVWEIHLADGQWHKGYWLDSHSGLPTADLLAETAALVPRLPSLRAILLEIIPEQIDARSIAEEDIASCLCRMREIWANRGSEPAHRVERIRPTSASADLPRPEEWEAGVEAALRGAGSGPARRFQDDPGLQVYRDLIAMVRKGTVAEAMPLTLRYLRRSLGEAALEALLLAFWRQAPPEPFPSEEARNFAGFVRSETALPHLDEVIAFELAAHVAAATGEPQYVSFTCSPEPFLTALKTGGPLEFVSLAAEVEVTPP